MGININVYTMLVVCPLAATAFGSPEVHGQVNNTANYTVPMIPCLRLSLTLDSQFVLMVSQQHFKTPVLHFHFPTTLHNVNQCTFTHIETSPLLDHYTITWFAWSHSCSMQCITGIYFSLECLLIKSTLFLYQVMLTHLLSILSLMKSFTILANFHSSCHCHHHLQSPQTEDLFSFFHFQTMSLTVPLPPPFYTLPKVH